MNNTFLILIKKYIDIYGIYTIILCYKEKTNKMNYMENFNDKENLIEMVLREKRLQMSNQYAETATEYGAEHPYPKALQSKFRTFDAFVFEFFGLQWDSTNIEYVKPVVRDNNKEKNEK